MISVCFVAKSELVSVERNFQPRVAIDEKHEVEDAVFLGMLREDVRGNVFVSCFKSPEMGEFVNFGIDSNVARQGGSRFRRSLRDSAVYYLSDIC